MKAERWQKTSICYSNLILPLDNDHTQKQFVGVIPVIIGLKLFNH